MMSWVSVCGFLQCAVIDGSVMNTVMCTLDSIVNKQHVKLCVCVMQWQAFKHHWTHTEHIYLSTYSFCVSVHLFIILFVSLSVCERLQTAAEMFWRIDVESVFVPAGFNDEWWIIVGEFVCERWRPALCWLIKLVQVHTQNDAGDILNVIPPVSTWLSVAHACISCTCVVSLCMCLDACRG